MNNLTIFDELDQAIDRMLAAAEADRPAGESEMGELLEVARELRDLPRANFKTRLRLELEWEAAGRTVTATPDQQRELAAKPEMTNTESLPGLFGKAWQGYPVRRSNMVLSLALHGLMVLAMGAGLVMVKSTIPRRDIPKHTLVELHPYRVPFPPGGDHGGSGGAMDKTKPSVGAPPKPSPQQLAPPVMVRNMQPRIAAESTMIAPPAFNCCKRELGDPLSSLAVPSAGPGVSGGMGGESGGGIGDRPGPGRGSGAKAGCCGDGYGFGNGVIMPRAIYSPEPEYSEEARRIKFQGEVTLLATIGVDGRPRNIMVVRAVGMGLDEKARQTVSTWRFEPARKDGHPVAVQMNIVINFRLY